MVDRLLDHEAQRQIGFQHPLFLRAQQARQDGHSARLQRLTDLGRQEHQRRGQDVGEDQIIGGVLGDARIAQAVGEIELALGVVDLGVLVGDAGRGLVDVGADGDGRARLGRRDGQNARAAADVQHLIEFFGRQQIVEGLQATDRGAVVAGAEGRARVDLQVDAPLGDLALVVRAIDEEAPGLDRRQARQAHGQPVGVGQLLDNNLQTRRRAQGFGYALGFVVRRREGVDAPHPLVLILLQNGVGRVFQHGIGVDGGGGGFGRGAVAACDHLNCGLGHFSNTVMMTNRNACGRMECPCPSRGRGIHG
ncbi:hypothetical protein D3C85_1151270 [compost metagenome]